MVTEMDQNVNIDDVDTKMEKKSLIHCTDVNVFYDDKQALFNVDLNINEKEVTSLIGPSGCGKSTFIRCLNRMNDVIETCSFNGSIIINGQDIYCLLYTSDAADE